MISNQKLTWHFNINLRTFESSSVHLFNSAGCILGIFKLDKSIPLFQGDLRDGSAFRKEISEFALAAVMRQVVDIDLVMVNFVLRLLSSWLVRASLTTTSLIFIAISPSAVGTGTL